MQGRCPRKFAPPPQNMVPPKGGPNFLGNMAPPGAIFPRKFGPPLQT